MNIKKFFIEKYGKIENSKLYKLLIKYKVFYIIIFVLYAIINFVLLLHHEPWRDEVHAWLMAKKLSIPELIVESRYDGHPILWHLILMPFAKLNFPIITLNLISYFILLVTVWLFLFKTHVNSVIKVFATFTIPFTYIFGCISRNYSLILLLLVIIAILYPKRYKKPISYSILIALLVHTHSLAWGIVAGLTITFHFYEIFLYFKKKNISNIKNIIIGLSLIVISTLLVVAELFGTSNPDYSIDRSSALLYQFIILLGFLTLCCFLYTFLITKKNYKEFFILAISLGFKVIVYFTFYSYIHFQRQMLVYVFLLFYLMLLPKDKEKTSRFIPTLFFIAITVVFGFTQFLIYLECDYSMPFSGAQECASYINENVPDNTTILIDNSVMGQTILPYLKPSISFYDIEHDRIVDCANTSHDYKNLYNYLNTTDLSGKYIIICNGYFNLGKENLLFYTSESFNDENYGLYYINK